MSTIFNLETSSYFSLSLSHTHTHALTLIFDGFQLFKLVMRLANPSNSLQIYFCGFATREKERMRERERERERVRERVR